MSGAQWHWHAWVRWHIFKVHRHCTFCLAHRWGICTCCCGPYCKPLEVASVTPYGPRYRLQKSHFQSHVGDSTKMEVKNWRREPNGEIDKSSGPKESLLQWQRHTWVKNIMTGTYTWSASQTRTVRLSMHQQGYRVGSQYDDIGAWGKATCWAAVTTGKTLYHPLCKWEHICRSPTIKTDANQRSPKKI